MKATQLQFDKVPTRTILFGVVKELYKRYEAEIWITATCLEFAYIIWVKIGL